MEFRPIRARDHRDYVAPAFGAVEEDGNLFEPRIPQLMGNPKTSAMAIQVFMKLQEQFSEYGQDRNASQDDERYRNQLENLANILETMLEETLNEIETLEESYSVGLDFKPESGS